MDGRHALQGLYLHDNQVADEEIVTVRRLDLNSVVDERQSDLSFDRETGFGELVRETNLVGALEKARSERLVHGQGAAEDLLPNLILGHLCALCAFSAASAFTFTRAPP